MGLRHSGRDAEGCDLRRRRSGRRESNRVFSRKRCSTIEYARTNSGAWSDVILTGHRVPRTPLGDLDALSTETSTRRSTPDRCAWTRGTRRWSALQRRRAPGQVLPAFDDHKYPYIDPAQDQPDLTRLLEVDPSEGFVLHPGEFVLASTLETVTLPDDLAARVEGKSSLGRLGLLTHATAGFVDPGFSGHVTLELSNVATLPIMLWPGMKIGQLAFFRLSSSAETPYGSAKYGSHYQGQRGPTASRSFDNFHRTDV